MRRRGEQLCVREAQLGNEKCNPPPIPPPYTHTYGAHTHTRSPSLYPPLRKERVEVEVVVVVEGGLRKGRGRGDRKRWRRGQIGALKFMAFFLFSLLKINSVYYE